MESPGSPGSKSLAAAAVASKNGVVPLMSDRWLGPRFSHSIMDDLPCEKSRMSWILVFNRFSGNPPFLVLFRFARHAPAHIEKHHNSSWRKTVAGFYDCGRVPVYFGSETILRQISHSITVSIENIYEQRASRLGRRRLCRSEESV